MKPCQAYLSLGVVDPDAQGALEAPARDLLLGHQCLVLAMIECLGWSDQAELTWAEDGRCAARAWRTRSTETCRRRCSHLCNM